MKPITVYWSPYLDSQQEKDWSFLYPKPVNLFSDHLKNKNKSSKNHFFQCPASALKMKKTLVFNSPMTFGYDYDFTDNKTIIEINTKEAILMYNMRDSMLDTGPNFKVALSYSFFADQSLDVSFTSPFFHKATYMQGACSVPGNFNIGEWYRPYSLELQAWSNKGSINFVENEPLFYAEFKTDRPIILKRYSQSDLLIKYSHSNVDSTNLFGIGQTLKSRYERFRSVGMREKILTEINKNIIDEEYMTL